MKLIYSNHLQGMGFNREPIVSYKFLKKSLVELYIDISPFLFNIDNNVLLAVHSKCPRAPNLWHLFFHSKFEELLNAWCGYESKYIMRQIHKVSRLRRPRLVLNTYWYLIYCILFIVWNRLPFENYRNICGKGSKVLECS